MEHVKTKNREKESETLARKEERVGENVFLRREDIVHQQQKIKIDEELKESE